MAPRSPTTNISTDRRLLDLATEHLRRHGAARLTITEIARAAAMSHANVYRHYASKAALLDAITAAWLAPLEASLQVIADAPDPAYDKLERLLRAVHRGYANMLVTEPQIFDLFCTATQARAGNARRHQQRIARAVFRILEEGMSNGTYPPRDLGATERLVLDTMYRFLSPLGVRSDVDIPGAEIESRIARLLAMLGNALARTEP